MILWFSIAFRGYEIDVPGWWLCNAGMQILIDELRLADLKRLFTKTESHKLHEFVKIFKETALDAVNALVSASPETKTEDLKNAAHRLRGASLNIGAPALADLAAAMEKKLKKGDRAGLTEDIQQLTGLHQETLRELSRVLLHLLNSES